MSISLFLVITPTFVQELYIHEAIQGLWGKLTPPLAEARDGYYGSGWDMT